jgi:hypothetical protein
MFLETHPIMKRIIAYWVITYGIVRLYAGLVMEYHMIVLAAITYFLEAICFLNEYYNEHAVHFYKMVFVCISSFILGGYILYDKI